MGELNDVVVTCPWHGWRFNVTNGRCLENDADLRCYPVHVESSDVSLLKFYGTYQQDNRDARNVNKMIESLLEPLDVSDHIFPIVDVKMFNAV